MANIGTVGPHVANSDPWDHLARLICAMFNAPAAMVSVQANDQTRFRAVAGIESHPVLCDTSITRLLVGAGPGAVLIVEDALEDDRVKSHPWVTGAPGLRFYAGVTVSNRLGKPIGAVGVMDVAPRRPLSPQELASLHGFAAMAGHLVDQADSERGCAEKVEMLELAGTMAGVGYFHVDLASGAVRWSDEIYRIHGFEPGEVDPTLQSAIGAYHEDDAQVIRDLVTRTLKTGEGYEAQLRLVRADGEKRITRSKALAERDETGAVTGLLGVFQDVTDSVNAHARVAESEALFRLMSETSTDVIARYKPGGEFLYLSPSAERVLGRRPEDLVGRNCADIIHPDDREETFAKMAAYASAEPDTKAHVEYRALRADGVVIWLEASPRAIRDKSGRVVEMHDHVRDITRRKVQERKQAEMVETLKLAETVARIGNWRLDLASQTLTWSDEIYHIHGTDPVSFHPTVEKSLAACHEDDRARVTAWIRNAGGSDRRDVITHRIVLPGGRTRIVESHCRVEMSSQGAPVAFFGVVQDVTEQEEARERLERRERQYRLLAENVGDVIARIQPGGLSNYISPAIESLLGFTALEMAGQTSQQFVHPDDRPDVLAVMKKGFAGKKSQRIQHRALRKDGRAIWVESHFQSVADGAGGVRELVVVIRDISDRKVLEDALIFAKEKAEAAALAKSEFLSNMSHELRTPLTSVIGFSALLEASDALPQAERRYADRIATSSKALLGVINDILDYSKLEAGAVELEPFAFSPRDLVNEARDIIETQCQAKGLALAIDLEQDVPERVVGDAGRIRQILLNFLSNATKFTGSGEVRLTVRASSEADGRRIRFAVRDSGIGIAADKIDQLFDRFTQADASTTRVYGGTGLGLAICKRLVDMMGGEIGVESRPGQGSTFWFEVVLPDATDLNLEPTEALRQSFEGLRILMADDAASNRELVSVILGGMGCEVQTACDGAEAVQAASTGGHDLILMDVQMPVMDGLAATRAIRALAGSVSGIPIIALTANVQADQMARCLDAGMDAHVGKPIQVPDLVRTISACLALRVNPEAAYQDRSVA